jgi:hypothetical protein
MQQDSAVMHIVYGISGPISAAAQTLMQQFNTFIDQLAYLSAQYWNQADPQPQC